MTDDAARYQELIDRGYADHTARHIVAQELNDGQLSMMVVCGMLPEPGRRPFPDESAELRAWVAEQRRVELAELRARVAELEAVVAGEEQRNAQRDAVAEVSAAYRAEWGRLQAQVEALTAVLTEIASRCDELQKYGNRSMTIASIRALLAAVPAPLHEWRCPSCGATTRARMADQEPEYCTCEPKPTGEAPDEPDYDCPVHGEGPPPKRDPGKDIPLINGEPAF